MITKDCLIRILVCVFIRNFAGTNKFVSSQLQHKYINTVLLVFFVFFMLHEINMTFNNFYLSNGIDRAKISIKHNFGLKSIVHLGINILPAWALVLIAFNCTELYNRGKVFVSHLSFRLKWLLRWAIVLLGFMWFRKCVFLFQGKINYEIVGVCSASSFFDVGKYTGVIRIIRDLKEDRFGAGIYNVTTFSKYFFFIQNTFSFY